jgi:hypothetical protein
MDPGPRFLRFTAQWTGQSIGIVVEAGKPRCKRQIGDEVVSGFAVEQAMGDARQQEGRYTQKSVNKTPNICDKTIIHH